MLFKRSRRQMGVIIRKPTPIVVPKDLKSTIAKDRKEVAAIDDAQEAGAFNIDNDYYMELSAKPFLELEEMLELKKCNLATHYGVKSLYKLGGDLGHQTQKSLQTWG